MKRGIKPAPGVVAYVYRHALGFQEHRRIHRQLFIDRPHLHLMFNMMVSRNDHLQQLLAPELEPFRRAAEERRRAAELKRAADLQCLLSRLQFAAQPPHSPVHPSLFDETTGYETEQEDGMVGFPAVRDGDNASLWSVTE